MSCPNNGFSATDESAENELFTPTEQTDMEIQLAQEQIDRKIAKRAVFITLHLQEGMEIGVLSDEQKLELLGLAIGLVE